MKQISLPSSPTKLAKDSPESLPGQPGAGRPKNSKDTNQRKTKTFKPQTGASLTLWAAEAQDKISQILNPVLLEFYNKKNLRSLSNEETKEIEAIKTKILFGLDPFGTVSTEIINKIFPDINKEEYKTILMGYNNWLKQLANDLNKQLSMEEQKQAKAAYYSTLYSQI